VQALAYLLLISEVDETEIFKICLEYWNTLASELYRDNPCTIPAPLFVNKQVVLELPPRRLLYIPVLSKVCSSLCLSCGMTYCSFLLFLYFFYYLY